MNSFSYKAFKAIVFKFILSIIFIWKSIGLNIIDLFYYQQMMGQVYY